MKITIDLNDPEIQRSLETQIRAQLQAITSKEIHDIIDSILEKKLDRVTLPSIQKMVEQRVDAKVAEAFKNQYGGRNEFKEVLAEAAFKAVKEQLSQGRG